jgi:hypothetical protein
MLRAQAGPIVSVLTLVCVCCRSDNLTGRAMMAPNAKLQKPSLLASVLLTHNRSLVWRGGCCLQAARTTTTTKTKTRTIRYFLPIWKRRRAHGRARRPSAVDPRTPKICPIVGGLARERPQSLASFCHKTA